MKYQSSITRVVLDINFEGGKKRHKCPECSEGRKKKSIKDLQFYPNDNRAYCHHCLTTFFEYKPNEKQDQ